LVVAGAAAPALPAAAALTRPRATAFSRLVSEPRRQKMSQQRGVKRVFEIPTAVVDEDGALIGVDGTEAHERLRRMIETMLEFGGTLIVQAKRLELGQLGEDPLAVTVGLVGQWKPNGPIERAEPAEPSDEQQGEE
jgi:hypothetical protein